MSAEKLIIALEGSTAITAEVEDRIELAPVSQSTRTPHISYEYEGDDPVSDLSGMSAITRQDWAIHVTAKSFIVAERIKNTVMSELSGQHSDFYAIYQGSEHSFDDDADTHQFSLSFRITY